MKSLLTTLGLLVTVAAYAGSPQAVTSQTREFVGTSNTEVLAANKNRGYLFIQNNGSSLCRVKFGSAITGSEGFQLQEQQNFEPQQAYIKSSVNVLCNLPSQSIELLETNW